MLHFRRPITIDSKTSLLHAMHVAQVAAGSRSTAPAPARRPAARLRLGSGAFCRHRSSIITRSKAEYKELLRTLQPLDDASLAAWAADNRDRLSLTFLSWLSEEELNASADEPDAQQALWELGSKLMALREGLAPVSNEVLQQELREAALRCATGVAFGSGNSTDLQDAERLQDAQQPAGRQQGEGGAPGALVTPAFGSAVQSAAALGLSPEGMALFQQQAAALETVVGTSRARSLVEVIGRAKVEDTRQVQGLAEADAAVRILDVLLSVHDREERAAILPDAFTPPSSTAAVDDDAAYFSPEEDQLFTTPLRLLQAIDLYLARLRGSAGGTPRNPLAALPGGSLGLSVAQLQDVLFELREDVETYWQSSDSDAC